MADDSLSDALKVTERRASAVAAVLMQMGVDQAIVSSTAYGSAQPLEPGVRSPFNRRAEVYFDYEPPPAPVD